jgi:glycosyltransferase involved in cell wall biosynthesis
MGGVNYVLNLARALRSLPADERPHITLLTAAPDAEKIAAMNADLGDRIAPFQETLKLGLDFVYPATQLAEAPFGVPWAGWIPDWQCRHMPDFFSPRERARRFIQYRILATHAPVCALSSAMAAQDTAELFPDSDVPRRVLPFPALVPAEVHARTADRLRETRQRLGVPERYMIICNQFWRHKNHQLALEALKHVAHADVHLVMSGLVRDERWPDYESTLKGLLNEPEIARRTTLLGSIARDDQLDLMLGALGVLQPSRFEGWSTVVEEARLLGLPILMSEFPVHREQNPPGGVFFDPDDAIALAALMDQWFANPPPRVAHAAARHADYVRDCARAFMSIAREAHARYDAAAHDPKAVAAAALAEIQADLAAGRHDFVADDQTLFQAGVRQLFREYPEELAGLAALVCDTSSPLYPGSIDTLITATLAKMPADARKRFFECEFPEPTPGVDAARRAASTPATRALTSAKHVLISVRDHVRRRLAN